jgi:hypothetical protein
MPVKSRIVDLRRTSFVKEATRIQQRARGGETVVVRLAQIVFFCANRDAWMLDLEDRFARCLMRDGVALPYGITETKRQFLIEWNGDFTIEGDVFVWMARGTGTTTPILGYPMCTVAEMS